MKITRAILLSTSLLAGISAFGQRADIFGEYSYLHFSPTVANSSSRGFNGGGGGIDLYFLKILGVKADFMAYSSTTFTVNFNTAVTTPGGEVIPAGVYQADGNMFTYLFGPVLRIPLPMVKPFGEVLFGGSHTTTYENLAKAINSVGGSITTSGQHPFTLAAGGGVDVSVSRRLALRLGEFDYVLTKYRNPLTSKDSQNNFRYTGGIVIKF